MIPHLAKNDDKASLVAAKCTCFLTINENLAPKIIMTTHAKLKQEYINSTKNIRKLVILIYSHYALLFLCHNIYITVHPVCDIIFKNK